MAQEKISSVGQLKPMVLKSDRKRMQKEEELKKQTKENTGATSNYERDDVDLAFDRNTTMGEFMEQVLMQLEKKKQDVKKTKETKRKKQKIATFFMKMSVINENEEEHQQSMGQDGNMPSQADSEMDEATNKDIEQDMEELKTELYYKENEDEDTEENHSTLQQEKGISKELISNKTIAAVIATTEGRHFKDSNAKDEQNNDEGTEALTGTPLTHTVGIAKEGARNKRTAEIK